MKDYMFVADSLEAWQSFALLDGAMVDEIGPIGDDLRYHVNVRCEPQDSLKSGGAGVVWLDPTVVGTPYRIWAGGMDFA